MGLRNEKCKERFIQEWLFNTADTPYRELIQPLTSCEEGSVLLETARNKCSIITDPAGRLSNINFKKILKLFLGNDVQKADEEHTV